MDANAVLEAGEWAVPGGQGAPGYVEGTGVGGPTGEHGGSGYAIVQFEQRPGPSSARSRCERTG